jgi:hypothetical protein
MSEQFEPEVRRDRREHGGAGGHPEVRREEAEGELYPLTEKHPYPPTRYDRS